MPATAATSGDSKAPVPLARHPWLSGNSPSRVQGHFHEVSKQKYVSPVFMAKIYSGLQDKEKAFAWLEKAYEDRSLVSVGFIKTNPMFDPLRSDPRYADLLRRTNLQP